MKNQTKKWHASLYVLCILLLGGCAEGYDSPDGFNLGVTNTQMKTPIQDSISFIVSTDGKTATVDRKSVV